MLKLVFSETFILFCENDSYISSFLVQWRKRRQRNRCHTPLTQRGVVPTRQGGDKTMANQAAVGRP